MKVLHVINNLGSGGAEKLVVEVCNELATKYETGLFLLDNKNLFFLQNVSPKVKIFDTAQNKLSFRTFFLLYKTIKQYDIIHAHLFPTLYIISFLSIFFPRKLFVFTEHNTTNGRRNLSPLRRIEKQIYKQYDVITCISNAAKTYLENWIGPCPKIILLYNFVDSAAIEKVQALDINTFGYAEEDRVIVMVGSFSNKQKRQDDIIEALTHLSARYKAVFIGEGQKLDQYKEIVRKKSLQDRVTFLGKRNDVYSILKSCHYGVLSSEWEGFGLVALEYMACGIPSIGTNVEGLSEVIADSSCLYQKGDAKHLAKIISTLEKNNDFQSNLLLKQHEVLWKFNKKVYFEQLINRIYRPARKLNN